GTGQSAGHDVGGWHQQLLRLVHVVFFYCFGDRRDLHSFPTRRSSDLFGRNCTVSGCKSGDSRTAQRSHTPATESWPSSMSVWARDRKRTRVNPSHVAISYAALRLKKNNPRRNDPADRRLEKLPVSAAH